MNTYGLVTTHGGERLKAAQITCPCFVLRSWIGLPHAGTRRSLAR